MSRCSCRRSMYRRHHCAHTTAGKRSMSCPECPERWQAMRLAIALEMCAIKKQQQANACVGQGGPARSCKGCCVGAGAAAGYGGLCRAALAQARRGSGGRVWARPAQCRGTCDPRRARACALDPCAGSSGCKATARAAQVSVCLRRCAAQGTAQTVACSIGSGSQEPLELLGVAEPYALWSAVTAAAHRHV